MSRRSVTLQGGQSASYQYDLNGNLIAGDSANPLVGELPGTTGRAVGWGEFMNPNITRINNPQ